VAQPAADAKCKVHLSKALPVTPANAHEVAAAEINF
jgi:hypothetical protein